MIRFGKLVPGVRSSPFLVHRRCLSLANLVHNSHKDNRYQSYVIEKRFPYPQKLVYEVVSSVDQYENFIPFCTHSFINSRDSKGQPNEAGLKVGFKEFDEEFTCKLHCVEPKKVTAKSITHSLFNFLETEWTIVPLTKDLCSVKLTLKYEFKSALYNSVSSVFASKVAVTMTRSFEKRSYEIHNHLND